MSQCAESEPFALQVTDDSMEPEFPSGCIIIIEPINQCRDGQFVFAEYDEVRWFRQFVIHADIKYLAALNDNYPAIELSDDYAILGVITQRNVKRKIKHYPV